MMDFYQYGNFLVYVDGEFFQRFRCACYCDVLDLTWPLTVAYPNAKVDIVLED